MFLVCQRSCNCGGANLDIVEQEEPEQRELAEELQEKPTLKGILKNHDLPTAATADTLPSPPEKSLEESPAEATPQEEKAWAPLEEDAPIFELDRQRSEVANAKLPDFRIRVEAELIEGSESPEADRHFCSDATLLRYLCNCDGSEKKAMSMLKDTIKWRRKTFPNGTEQGCQTCLTEPKSHCFLHMGKDAAGRHVIYSCAGRAANKAVEKGMFHMSSELERIFDGNSAPGQVVWIVDFAGFGLVDCNPRLAATAVPMFASHYPERFGQIVLFAMPTLFRALYAAGMKILDPVMQRKVLILQTPEARKRYADHYWSCNPVMAEWIQAVANCKGAPGCYPDVSLSRQLGDPSTVDILERCCN